MQIGEYVKWLWRRKEVPKCEMCERYGIKTYRTLTIHHVNGHRNDNEFNNLKVICVKCHRILNEFVKLPDNRGIIIKSYLTH